jgi:formate hydrogenlyase subunit 6/NADH:ubiquinone oxidoreductase subunit I
MGKILGLDGNSKQMNVNIDITEHPTIKCKACEGIFFTNVILLKKISKIATGSTNDQLVPIQVLRCADCYEVLEESVSNPKILQ